MPKCSKYINVKGYTVKPYRRCADKKKRKKTVAKNITTFKKAPSGPVNKHVRFGSKKRKTRKKRVNKHVRL